MGVSWIPVFETHRAAAVRQEGAERFLVIVASGSDAALAAFWHGSHTTVLGRRLNTVRAKLWTLGPDDDMDSMRTVLEAADIADVTVQLVCDDGRGGETYPVLRQASGGWRWPPQE